MYTESISSTIVVHFVLYLYKTKTSHNSPHSLALDLIKVPAFFLTLKLNATIDNKQKRIIFNYNLLLLQSASKRWAVHLFSHHYIMTWWGDGGEKKREQMIGWARAGEEEGTDKEQWSTGENGLHSGSQWDTEYYLYTTTRTHRPAYTKTSVGYRIHKHAQYTHLGMC